jgi:hypothetical protein
MKQIIKKTIKFLVVVAIPLIALFLYVHNIKELFNQNVLYIILWHFALLFVLYNAIFYSHHMSKTTISSRFHISIVKAFGIFIAHDDAGLIQLLIGCVGIEFNYKGLLSKQKAKGNHFKPENKF